MLFHLISPFLANYMGKEMHPIVLVMYVIEKLIRQMNFFSRKFRRAVYLLCIWIITKLE